MMETEVKLSSELKIVKVIRRGKKNSRVLLDNNSTVLVLTSLLEKHEPKPKRVLKTGNKKPIKTAPPPVSLEHLLMVIKNYQISKTPESRKLMYEVFYTFYDKRIENTIRKMSFSASEEKVEDLKNSVYERLVSQDALSIFDPNKGSITTFIFYVINTVVRNDFHKHKTDAVTAGMEFTDHVSSSMEMSSDEFLTSIEDKALSQSDQFDSKSFFYEFEKHLEEFGRWGDPILNEETGEIFHKSYLDVFKLMAKGYRVKDIAETLKVTDGSASSYCKEVKAKLTYFLKKNDLKASDFLKTYGDKTTSASL